MAKVVRSASKQGQPQPSNIKTSNNPAKYEILIKPILAFNPGLKCILMGFHYIAHFIHYVISLHKEGLSKMFFHRAGQVMF